MNATETILKELIKLDEQLKIGRINSLEAIGWLNEIMSRAKSVLSETTQDEQNELERMKLKDEVLTMSLYKAVKSLDTMRAALQYLQLHANLKDAERLAVDTALAAYPRLQ